MNALALALHAAWLRRRSRIAQVSVRPIRPDDEPALQWFVHCLSPDSRRFRFHAALNELPEPTLRALTRVDQREHVAFVLTVTKDGIERIVGEARFVRSGDRDTAEFGIAVADAYQGTGLADRLLEALIDAARAAGLRWLVGDVLASNARMLSFTRRRGFAATTRETSPGLVRLERSVDHAPAAYWASRSWIDAWRTARRWLARSLPAT